MVQISPVIQGIIIIIQIKYLVAMARLHSYYPKLRIFALVTLALEFPGIKNAVQSHKMGDPNVSALCSIIYLESYKGLQQMDFTKINVFISRNQIMYTDNLFLADCRIRKKLGAEMTFQLSSIFKLEDACLLASIIMILQL